MTASCVRQTELPNTTKLFSDFLYHPDRVSRFYPYLPLSADTFERTAAAIRFPDERRRALVEALSIENGGDPLLERLARPGTVAVVTGQQTGLFTGPAYTIYKALTAIKLAEHLTASGIDAVPIFWLATEDHDLAEVDHCWVFGETGEPELCRAEITSKGNRPVGRVVPESVPTEALHRAMRHLPFSEEVVESVRSSYTAGASLGTGFGRLLRKVLGNYRILQLDPMLDRFRQMAAPLLRTAVEQMPELISGLVERGKELSSAGYHAQVKIENSTSLVFLLRDGKRIALRRTNGTYSSGKQRFSASELASRAEGLSPNALLRPVVQDYFLPTITYVGGPSELAYLAQSELLYSRLLGRQPIAVHRSGFTILDEHSWRAMRRFHLVLPDLFGGLESVREQAARQVADRAVLKRVGSARQNAVSSLSALTGDIEQFDPSLSKALATSRRKIAYQFEKIERKVAREALRKDELASRQITQLFNLLYPKRHLQERLYSILPFLAKHGTGLIPRLYAQISLDCPDHQVIAI